MVVDSRNASVCPTRESDGSQYDGLRKRVRLRLFLVIASAVRHKAVRLSPETALVVVEVPVKNSIATQTSACHPPALDVGTR